MLVTSSLTKDRILAIGAINTHQPLLDRPMTMPPTAPTAVELAQDTHSSRLSELNELIELMRPSVQYDGGDINLVSADTDTGVIEVQLTGSCSSCAISTSTLADGVTRILTTRLPWVTEVIGSVDDSVDPFESMSQGRGAYTPNF
jgi:Fe-S cluster biogenesis protein NfuA